MINVLISQPGFQYKNKDFVYLPYLFAVLKSFCNRDPLIRENVLWLDPIFYYDDPHSYKSKIESQPIHVVGLSCYIWNWSFNLEIAEMVKKAHPTALVVMGGPQPDWNDPEFFVKYPFVDVIVKRDGERPFYQILSQLIKGKMELNEISGLVWNQKGRAEDTGPPQMNTDFDYYPYRECENLFKKVIQESQQVTTILETNRGCPYSCSFCDIGSKEFSRLRQVPLSRVEEELDWIATHQVNHIFCTDSNFGILPRDKEIAKLAGSLKRKHGFPEVWEYDSAKMHLENNFEIARTLWKEKLITKYKVPWQHLDEGVLQAIQRREPVPAKKAAYAKKVEEYGIKCRPELILGMPGDTPEKFRNAVFDIFEFGFSDSLRVNLMLILPNAPANKRSYRDLWKIRTVEKPVAPLHITYDKNYSFFKGSSNVEVVVGTKSYSESDWIQMMTDDAILRVFHSVGQLTFYLSYFAKRFLHLSDAQFYTELLDSFCRNKKYKFISDRVTELENLRYEYLSSDRIDFYQYEGLDTQFLLGGSEFFYARIMEDPGQFYSELQSHFLKIWPTKEKGLIEDLFDFQQNMLITSEYDYKSGKTFFMEYDWCEFFADLLNLDHWEKGPPGQALKNQPVHVLVSDQMSSYLKGWEFNWSDGANECEVRTRWLEVMTREWNHWSIEGTRTFKDIKILNQNMDLFSAMDI